MSAAEQLEHPAKCIIRLCTRTDKARALDLLSSVVPSEERPMVVTLEPWEEKRNQLQNRYLWGWLYKNIVQQLEDAGIVIPLDDGREYPYTADMLHEIFKETFLCYDTIVHKGKERKLCYSTTQLLRKAKQGEEQRSFRNYVTQIKQFVHQMWAIDIPPTWNEDFRSLERELNSGAYR